MARLALFQGSLYNADKEPAMIERDYGKGSIVLAADSYFLSNEAMRAERDPLLIACLVGSSNRVVFDETHLGLDENPGIASLIREFNLGWLIAAIAILAGLFIWQQSSPFLPPRGGDEGERIVTGKDSASGFVNLLRRGITPRRLVQACVEQWKKSFAGRPGKFTAALERIDAAAAQGAETPLASYRAISQIVADIK